MDNFVNFDTNFFRNNESLYLLHPRKHKLSLLGLGSSVGTPEEGIMANVLVVKSFQELKDNPHKVWLCFFW